MNQRKEINAMAAVTRFERDDARGVYLGKVGDMILCAEVLIGPEGQEILVVERFGPGVDNCTFRLDAPEHEHLGPLPRQIQRRVWGNSTFCNRPNKAGKPCRSTVDRPGVPCRWHVGAEPMESRRRAEA